MTQFTQLVSTGPDFYQLLPSSLRRSSFFFFFFKCPYILFPLIPGGQGCTHRKHLGQSQPPRQSTECRLHADSDDYSLGDPWGPLLRPLGHGAPVQRRDPGLGEGQGSAGAGAQRGPASGAAPGTKERAGRRPPEPISARQPLATAVSDLQLPPPPARRPPGPARRLSVSSLPPYWTARVHFRAPGVR